MNNDQFGSLVNNTIVYVLGRVSQVTSQLLVSGVRGQNSLRGGRVSQNPFVL